MRGARASAIVYSIIETARANGLKPFEYLEFLLETLPNSTIMSIDNILPWGSAVPDRCRMPMIKDGARGAEKKQVGDHDGHYRLEVFGRGA